MGLSSTATLVIFTALIAAAAASGSSRADSRGWEEKNTKASRGGWEIGFLAGGVANCPRARPFGRGLMRWDGGDSRREAKLCWRETPPRRFGEGKSPARAGGARQGARDPETESRDREGSTTAAESLDETVGISFFFLVQSHCF